MAMEQKRPLKGDFLKGGGAGSRLVAVKHTTFAEKPGWVRGGMR